MKSCIVFGDNLYNEAVILLYVAAFVLFISRAELLIRALMLAGHVKVNI